MLRQLHAELKADMDRARELSEFEQSRLASLVGPILDITSEVARERALGRVITDASRRVVRREDVFMALVKRGVQLRIEAHQHDQSDKIGPLADEIQSILRSWGLVISAEEIALSINDLRDEASDTSGDASSWVAAANGPSEAASYILKDLGVIERPGNVKAAQGEADRRGMISVLGLLGPDEMKPPPAQLMNSSYALWALGFSRRQIYAALDALASTPVDPDWPLGDSADCASDRTKRPQTAKTADSASANRGRKRRQQEGK